MFSKNNTVVTKAGHYNWNSVVKGPVLQGQQIYRWRITIRQTPQSYIMIGVAPNTIDLNLQSAYNQCGWYFFCCDSTLHSGPPRTKSNFNWGKNGLKVIVNQYVDVELNIDAKTIGYGINGAAIEKAYDNIPTDQVLCPCVLLRETNDSVSMQAPKT